MSTLQGFSSRFGFIMAATGAAVGLGNIWKFPYMAGDNGGSAFVLVYVLCVLLIGFPNLIGEVMIGRLARKNPIDAFQTLSKQFGRSSRWTALGWLGAFTLFLVLAFYSVVAGWSIAYVLDAARGYFINRTPSEIEAHFNALLASPTQQVLWHSVFMFCTLGVVCLGVRQGIEKLSRWMMPALFFILILLVSYSLDIGDGKAAISFLFGFRPEALNARVMIAALGHAFFTLAIGAGAMLVYGAYTPPKMSLGRTLGIAAFLDVMVAFLAGLAIFPMVFSHHLTPQAGPGLMFKVLPIAFQNIPYGHLVGFAFFILLLFAAWTSSISMAEPLVMMFCEKYQLKRITSSLIIGVMCWGLGLVSALSFNVWSDITFFNHDLFSIMTDIPTNILLPLGGISYAVFAGYVIHRKVAAEALGTTPFNFAVWRFLIRTIAPIGIAIVLLTNLF